VGGVTATAARAVGERAAGGRPSRLRSLLVAVTAAAGAGVVVYRLLRSGG
jgi:hypothetical protein